MKHPAGALRPLYPMTSGSCGTLNYLHISNIYCSHPSFARTLNPFILLRSYAITANDVCFQKIIEGNRKGLHDAAPWPIHKLAKEEQKKIEHIEIFEQAACFTVLSVFAKRSASELLLTGICEKLIQTCLPSFEHMFINNIANLCFGRQGITLEKLLMALFSAVSWSSWTLWKFVVYTRRGNSCPHFWMLYVSIAL